MRTWTGILAALGAVLALGACAGGGGVDLEVDEDLEIYEDDTAKDRIIVSGGSALTPRVLRIFESMPLLHGPGRECRPPMAVDPWSIHPSEVIRCQPERLPLSEADARAVVRGYIEAVDEAAGYWDREYPDPWEESLRAQWVHLLTESSRDGAAAETEGDTATARRS